ncbi:MAG TPA: type II toxin-antitoxin system RelE/ParE family toxin [Thermoanaerobaculia bacterium]|nr:type II toxin-antitoxin system RelE/ParE family toxin [Thermoanaerobaculia bacterium]
MRLRLVVAAQAERQIREAALWWHQNRRAAPGLFRQELTRGFELITTQPNVGPRALDLDLPEVRRLHLSRIRYYLYYRIVAQDTVEVLALWHTSRGEGPWINKTAGP